MPSQEFVKLSDDILSIIKSQMPASQAQWADQARFLIEDSPSDWHHNATGTPPGYTLLGMYMLEPQPTVRIFESSLVKRAGNFGGIENAIRETLAHEIYQHHFGEDHTKETADHGYAPAFALSDEGFELHQWEDLPVRR